jgi:hypothetical protein
MWDDAIAAQKAYVDATAETLTIDSPSMLKLIARLSSTMATTVRSLSN